MTTRRLIRAAIIAGVSLGAAGAANAEIFLKIASAPGDSSQRGFEDQIVLTGASLNVMSFQGADPEGILESVRTTSAGPLSLSKRPDRASPKLMMAAMQGQQLGPLEITFTSPARPGVAPAVEARWIIEGAEVSGFSTYPNFDGTSTQTETVDITYKTIRYQYFAKDNKGGRTGPMEEVTLHAPETSLYGFEGGCGG